jgi:excinuclease ABC B subunit
MSAKKTNAKNVSIVSNPVSYENVSVDVDSQSQKLTNVLNSTSKFELKANFEPNGDQPTAIAQLTEGFQQKQFKRQTLLGVTGSGKSLSFEMPIIVKINGRIVRVPIGTFVESQLTNPKLLGDTEYQSVTGSKIISINPKSSCVVEKEIIQISKHACDDIYEVTLDDGSFVEVTQDHNFYTLNHGKWELVTTCKLELNSILGVSDTNPWPEREVEWLQLADEKTTVDLGEFLVEKNIDSRAFSKAVSKKSMSGKYKHILSSSKKRGLVLHRAIPLLTKYGSDCRELQKIHCVTKGRVGIPAYLKITTDIAYFFGLYVSEGHCRRGIVLISNCEKQDFVAMIANKLSAGFNIRNKNDVVIHSVQLSKVMSQFGCNAYEKKVHSLVFNFSRENLVSFLQGVFDGDGWVEENSVCYSSVSKELIFGIKSLLLRFGIRSRVRKKLHNYVLSLYGIYAKKYLDEVGFSLLRKQNRYTFEKRPNTNVDLMYGTNSIFTRLRKEKNLSQKDLANQLGCTRSHISLIESGLRTPSKNIFEKLVFSYDELSEFRELCNVNLRKVVSINKKKNICGFVYDIAVKDNETFAGGYGDIFVHNTFAMSHIIQNLNLPTLILTHNKTLTAQLYNEMKDFFPNNAVDYFVSYFDYFQPESYLPASDTYIEKDSAVNPQIEQLRLRATMSLATRRDVIIVASISCIYGLGDPSEFKAMSFALEVGMSISRKAILEKFIEMQYERNDADLKPGMFRVRGDVIDIIPGYAKHIIRIELFGDEIESITEVHTLEQKKLQTYQVYILFPARHFVTSQYKLEKAVQTIKEELATRLPELEQLEAHRLKQRTNYDLEMIQELGYCNGIENYSRHFDGRLPGTPPFTLIDFFPDDFLLIVDESHVTIPQVHGMYKGDRSRKQSLIDYGFRLPSAYDNRPLTFEEFDAKLDRVLYVSATPSEYELKVSEQIAEMVVRPTGLVDPPITVRPKEGQMDDLLLEIQATTQAGFRTFVTTLTKKMAENLCEYLTKKNVKVRYLHSEIETLERTEILRQLRLGKFDVLVGINLLREGLDVPEVALVAILDADKEGFLRNSKSLIQTCGRAARNADGRVLFYADTMTRSMQETISEITRRREKQIAYNAKRGIVPQTILKPIQEKAIGKVKDKKHIPKTEVEAMIVQLTEEMDLASETLDFERAIELRDEIALLKKRLAE